MPAPRYACILVLAAFSSAPAAGPDLDGLPGHGIACNVGSTDGKIEIALASNGMSIVHGLAPDDASLATARAAIRAAGRYGPVSVDRIPARTGFPHADNLLNLVIADLDALGTNAPSRTEIMRVLAPGGTACLRSEGNWSRTMKPRPAGMDDWPYRRHGIDGNAVSSDTTGVPNSIRWVAGPLIGSGPAAVTAGGRLFAVFATDKDFGKKSATEPGEGDLIARDAFNGTPLWTGKGNVRLLFVDGGRLYTIRGKHPVALDPATGALKQTYSSIAGDKILSGAFAVGSRMILPMTDAIRCVDSDTAQAVWARAYRDGWEIRPEFGGYRGMNHSVVVADGSSLYFIEAKTRDKSRFELVSLDAATGIEHFRSRLNTYDETIPDLKYIRDLKTGVLRTAFVRSGVVAVTGRGGLQTFDARTGGALWEFLYRSTQKMGNYYGNCFYVNGLIWIGVSGLPAVGPLAPGPSALGTPPPEGETIETLFRSHSHPARPPGPAPTQRTFSGWLGRDARTGRMVKGLRTGRMLGGRCAPDVATSRFFLHTHMHATELDTGAFHKFTAFRQNCVLGAIVGNGLAYVFPNSCMCFRMMRGTAGLARADKPSPLPKAPDHGPAYGKTDSVPPDPGAWPMYRANPQRTAHTSSDLPAKLQLLWSRRLVPGHQARLPLRDWMRKEAGNWPTVTPPVTDGSIAVAAVPEDHSVVAFATKDGKELWRFTAAGRVPASPVLFRGLCLFSSNDGSVYALRAADGVLAWRYHINPRRIAAYGQLESVSPVQSGVLVAADGLAYVVIGRHTGLTPGMFVVALDPATGEPIATYPIPGDKANPEHVNTYSFHADWLSSDGESVRLGDIRIPQVSRAPPGKASPRPFVRAKSYAFIRERRPADLGHPAQFMTKAGALHVWLRSGKRGGLYAATGRLARVRNAKPIALFVAGKRLYLAEGVRLTAFDTETWKKGDDHVLIDSSGAFVHPVFDGFAVAHERLYVACKDGTLKCFGANTHNLR